MQSWSVQQAKKRLDALIEQAREAGPQLIEERERQVAVVLSPADYERLVAAKPTLKDWLLSSPGTDGLELERGRDNLR